MIATRSSEQPLEPDPRLDRIVDWLRALPDTAAGAVENGLATVSILRVLDMDEKGCIACLLHCADNPAAMEQDEALQFCDDETLGLYRGVTRLGRLSAFSRPGDERVDPEANEDNLRKMLITMVDDVRVVMIKLADQLRMLRDARDAPAGEKQALSRSTLDIYAPLANRLGIWQLKWEMEDLALRYSNPDAYRSLAARLDEKRDARERYIQNLLDTLRRALDETGIRAEVNGRPKHIYSIWRKMQNKGLAFENLWDIRAVRIVVDSVSDCYAALGIVHTHWRHLPGEFDDYIATPKPNGYRSIHTVVIGPEDKSVEVQIRTAEMHRENELGVAAHWRYKENRQQDDSIDNKVLWLRQLLEWKRELEQSESVADALKDAAENRRVYVFTPRGTVIDLPEGATPVDFAYAIHSEVGHATRGARVNGRMVPLGYRLQTGDQVHIQTQKGASPSRDWLRPELELVHTQRARARIQQWFKQKDHDQHVADGRSLLEKELTRLGLEDLGYDRIVAKTPYNRPDDLLAALGAGDYKLSRALAPFRRELERQVEPSLETRRKPADPNPTPLQVNGVGNLMTSMARCCQPVPGDPIVGYITSGRGVTIHHQDCRNMQHLNEERRNRLIEVEWGQEGSASYPVEVEVRAYHRSGILHDISQVLKDNAIDVLKVNTETDEENLVRISMRLEVSGLTTLSRTLSRLARIQNVLEVRRQKN